MAETGHLQADPLFQGLTRPAMYLGVSFTYFVINAMVCMVIFINTGDPFYIFVVAPIIHITGMLICRNEPRAVELVMIKTGKCWKLAPISKVKRFHGFVNSYDVY